jgi:hypothetical protein
VPAEPLMTGGRREMPNLAAGEQALAPVGRLA